MELCSQTVEEFPVTIIPGIHFLSEDGLLKTFGRGGSDFTALLYAAYFECEALFYKDVPGANYPPGSATLVPSLNHNQLCELEVIQQQVAEFTRQKIYHSPSCRFRHQKVARLFGLRFRKLYEILCIEFRENTNSYMCIRGF